MSKCFHFFRKQHHEITTCSRDNCSCSTKIDQWKATSNVLPKKWLLLCKWITPVEQKIHLTQRNRRFGTQITVNCFSSIIKISCRKKSKFLTSCQEPKSIFRSDTKIKSWSTSDFQCLICQWGNSWYIPRLVWVWLFWHCWPCTQHSSQLNVVCQAAQGVTCRKLLTVSPVLLTGS